MKRYGELVLAARDTLRRAGVPGYDLEARLMACKAAGKTKEQYTAQSNLYAPDSVAAALETMLARRLAGEPVAYIVGEWEFYGLPIQVSPAVLIPRMDTELLAAEAIRRAREREGRLRVLDLCCGSGCIGLAIAANVPDARVVMADLSREAVKLARANALQNGLTRSVTVVEADALKRPPAAMGTYDLIVCNPPYIPTVEILSLDPSVRDYEPRKALDGGPDGLNFYRAVITKWAVTLRPGAGLLFECGEGQAEAVAGLLRVSGFTDIEKRLDTLGVERVVAGTYEVRRDTEHGGEEKNGSGPADR